MSDLTQFWFPKLNKELLNPTSQEKMVKCYLSMKATVQCWSTLTMFLDVSNTELETDVSNRYLKWLAVGRVSIVCGELTKV